MRSTDGIHATSSPPSAGVGRPGLTRPLTAASWRFGSRRAWKDALRRRLLAAADLLTATAAIAAIQLFGDSEMALAAFATLPVWIFLAKVGGLYDRDHARVCHQTSDELGHIFHWVTVSAAVTAVSAALLSGTALLAETAIAMWALSFAVAVLSRTAARAVWRRLVPPERGLVVGAGAVADAVARKFSLQRGHHLHLANRISLGDGPGHGATDIEEVEREIGEGRYERVIVALEDLDEPTLARLVTACRRVRVKFAVAPPLRAVLGTAVELSHLGELPLVEFRTWDPSRSTMLIKRTMDVVVASTLLVVLAPLMIAIAVAVRLDSRGPAIFRQRRTGRGGTPFEMLKFRTMVADAEARLAEHVSIDDLDDPLFKLRDDPRVTGVGRRLRRLSLDELPQLVNVLRGEMSLVGPRPEEVWLCERYEEADRFRLAVRPGMTGPMQVQGRGELTFQERLAVEREYIENYSLRKDIEIAFKTVPAVFDGLGAY